MNKKILCALIAPLVFSAGAAHADSPPPVGTHFAALPDHFTKRVLVTGLKNPHNMVLGPDGQLWLTEQATRRVLRVDPKTGKLSVLAEIPDVVYDEGHQNGLLGIALHPELLKRTGHDYVYVSMTYATGKGGDAPNATLIRRYTYDANTGKLAHPVDLIKGMPSSFDHQSARLLFGPDHKLYYSIGDQGHNQFSYLCQPNHAQDIPTEAQIKAADYSLYQGKILRLNVDGSIPKDNPVIHGVKSHIYAYGIRNTQGMVFSPNGKLFAAEHGPNTDDELNLIVPGGNYGWPHVAGRKDDSGYAYANWSAAKGGCEALREKEKDPAQNGLKVPDAVPVTKESQWSDPAFVEPIKTFYTVPSNFDFNDPVCADKNLYFICWPTIAPSSVTYYKGGPHGVPGWEHSLLITSLKRGLVFRVKLDATNTVAMGDATPLFRSINRYREIVASHDGSTIYVATDSAGLGTTEAGNASFKLDNPGSIIEFKYTAGK
ncbi:MAG: quinoprotein glucose dehydrogenase [Paraburkholderia sp.]|uniref:glucose/sorbosone family PQQ-dependent dehydrogenase n=1 Tax=Paraburkholderia sp. TaxID=1926495 RepID=UPI00122326DE|nr:glucose/sorbosone family PQQ-dependent dehydrogenase [Paraburkholderia sp.]TAM06893.1 MAG: quinoprotein glucose dehydrogenase [Paraburkholderia sp.]TAM32436.1 MAG: quinoprotein glucose dehydrogenase [Paraburkholderia sp.]